MASVLRNHQKKAQKTDHSIGIYPILFTGMVQGVFFGTEDRADQLKKPPRIFETDFTLGQSDQWWLGRWVLCAAGYAFAEFCTLEI